jgi:hypothetical protein
MSDTESKMYPVFRGYTAVGPVTCHIQINCKVYLALPEGHCPERYVHKENPPELHTLDGSASVSGRLSPEERGRNLVGSRVLTEAGTVTEIMVREISNMGTITHLLITNTH